MSIELEYINDNYFTTGLDSYEGAGAALGLTGNDTDDDYCNANSAATKNAVLPIRRSNLGLTYGMGILIPYSYDGADVWNFYPRANLTSEASDNYLLKFTARIRIIKASYEITPVAVTVAIGCVSQNSSSCIPATYKKCLVHPDEGWIDLAIMGLCTVAGAGTYVLNFKLGKFDANPDCLLLCDYWNVEIFKEW